MPGPWEQRLVEALQGAAPETVAGGGNDWNDSASILSQVAAQLQTTTLPTVPGEFGEQTAAAFNSSLARTSKAMADRARLMALGSQALGGASSALDQARSALQALGPEGSAPSYTPPDDPGSPQGIKAHHDYLSAVSAYNAQQQHREDVSRQHYQALTQELQKSTATMKKIHGQQDPPPPPRSYGPTGGSAGGSSYSGSVASAATPTPRGHGEAQQVHWQESGGGRPAVDHTYPTGQPGGAPYAGADPALSIPGETIPAPDGSGGGPGLGVLGAGAGGAAAAGLIGARLTNALRGGGLFGGGSASAAGGGSAVAGRGTAASSVRGIGASARTGGAGTIGRGAAAAEGEAATGRSAANGRSGAGTIGRSGAAPRSGGSARSGSTGRAGGRGGSGAAGRAGRRRDDEKGEKRDLFDVGEDWVGDDEAAPGVLD